MVRSIWVAIEEFLAAMLAFFTISFCTIGTRSIGISTPRSPRATITASTSPRISFKFSIPSDFSNLAMILAVQPMVSMYDLAKSTSSTVRTKDIAIQSTSCSRPNFKANLSSSVSTGISI